MGDNTVRDKTQEVALLLELLRQSGRPLPAAQLAATLKLATPLVFEHLNELSSSGKVVALRSTSRVVYGLRMASNAAPARPSNDADSHRRANQLESAGLDNTRKRLF